MTKLTAALLALAASSALAACQSGSDEDPYQEQLAKARSDALREVEQQDKEWIASNGPAPHGAEACATSIAVLMSQDARKIKREKLTQNKFAVRYRRDDGTTWKYHCDATADRVRWHSYEHGQEDRERAEDNIRYKAANNVLTLTMRGIDGNDYDYRYSLPSLQQLPKPCDVPATCGTPHLKK